MFNSKSWNVIQWIVKIWMQIVKVGVEFDWIWLSLQSDQRLKTILSPSK